MEVEPELILDDIFLGITISLDDNLDKIKWLYNIKTYIYR